MQYEQRRGFGTWLREFFARLTGRKVTNGNIGPAREGEGFKTFVALMIAVVTIIAAVVAWRSALTGTLAGNAEDAGLLASLNRQEALTVNSMLANEHRGAYLQYMKYQLMASLATVDGRLDDGTPEEILARIRPIQENFDLATTSKRFFPNQYIKKGEPQADTGGEVTTETLLAEAAAEDYDVDREVAQALAETARGRDIEPDPKFAEADALRDKSVALIATLILLAISLWFFAVAEAVSHWIKWVWAVGGILFLIIGSASAWAIEADSPLAEIYRMSELMSLISGGVIVLAALVGSIFFLIRRSSHAIAPALDEGDSPGEHRFKQVVTAMIASVALFAAVVGWLQADSGAKGDLGIRNAQRYAADALGTQAVGEAQVNYNYSGAGLAWRELDALLATARKESDTANAAVLEQTRDYIRSKSALLSNDTYFYPTNSIPYMDREGFRSDVYLVQQTEFAEKSRLEGELNNAWEDKANAYIVHLTLLAAALALFGLSLTFSGLARPVFVLVAFTLTMVTAWSVTTTFSKEVVYTSPEAVRFYAQGVGEMNRFRYDEALEAFNKSIERAPHYANAIYERGNSQYSKGNYEQAATDFQAARAAGRDDSSLAWNLGWTYYLLGRFDESIAESRKAYELDRKSFGARLNGALALLAQGKFDEARAEYRNALGDLTNEVLEAKAAKREVAPSVWFFMDASARDLESLNDALLDERKRWTEAPAKERVQDPDRVREVAEEIFLDLKTLIVALETAGQKPGDVPQVELGDLRFGTKPEVNATTYDENTSFQPTAGEIYVLFSHGGIEQGKNVQLKVYVDGYERPEYRWSAAWPSSEEGEEAISFTSDYSFSNAYAYDPGEYMVELYIDHHLFRRASFIVEQPNAEGSR
jgi:tetratricopeptide (TPR) repeat protein